MSQQSSNCGKCGICLSVCPVFAALKEEENSPRARVQLIKAFREGKLTSSALLKELMAKCLMCGSCTAACPSGIDHFEQFMETRADLIEKEGDLLEIRGLVFLLAKEYRLGLAAGMAKAGQAVLPEFLQKKIKVANISVDRFPNLNTKPFRSTVPEIIEPEGKVQGTVVYFTGCATNYIFAENGQATVKLLSALGYRVVIPKNQKCCSIPMLFHGGIQQAKDNLMTNVECLSGHNAEAVIVDCPTCGSALKKEFPQVIRKYGEDATKADKIAAKVTDIMQFINNRRDKLEELIQQGGKAKNDIITYHTPCHLRNSFISAEPMLRKLEAINFKPASDANSCCGGGGTFFYEYPAIATKMAETKAENAKRTGANIWLTDCPMCQMNLEGRLKPEDGIKMMHPVLYLSSLL